MEDVLADRTRWGKIFRKEHYRKMVAENVQNNLKVFELLDKYELI